MACLPRHGGSKQRAAFSNGMGAGAVASHVARGPSRPGWSDFLVDVDTQGGICLQPGVVSGGLRVLHQCGHLGFR